MNYDDILKQATTRPWAKHPSFADTILTSDHSGIIGYANDEDPETRDQCNANAALIVLAVNAHEALVRAAEDIIAHKHWNAWGADRSNAMDALESALALAKGGK